MDWRQLLSDIRVGREYQMAREEHRPPWQFDHDRITFSSAFRRLQDKTQVFPLSSSDYVRTRLTHSLEAAGVARSLANLVGFRLKAELPEIWRDAVHPLELGMITSAAALAHDIGNPPFGHAGEDAIRSWFSASALAQADSADFTARERSDFEKFEGNAQGFRIVMRLQMYRENGGMQLTAATLGAFSKYPAEVWINDAERPKNSASRKKVGFFQAEAERFEQLADTLGLIRHEGQRRGWCRHPLAFLVEAADDICYRIVDFEDAFQQKLLDFEVVKCLLQEIAGTKATERVARIKDRREQINYLRAMAIGEAISQAADVFIREQKRILDGTGDQSLISLAPCGTAFEKIRQVQQNDVYTNGRVLRVEAAGFKVIGGLLEAFYKAVHDVYAVGSKASPESCKLVALIPDDYIGADRKFSTSSYLRMLNMTDYICGMTDTYALELYRNLSGISLP